jgi:hypothetical protein
MTETIEPKRKHWKTRAAQQRRVDAAVASRLTTRKDAPAPFTPPTRKAARWWLERHPEDDIED